MDVKIPEVLKNYQYFMGGVDKLDQYVWVLHDEPQICQMVYMFYLSLTWSRHFEFLHHICSKSRKTNVSAQIQKINLQGAAIQNKIKEECSDLPVTICSQQ